MSASASAATTDRLTDRERRAWVGLLRAHASLTREIDAQLEAAHSLPLTSFEVLLYLADADGERIRMSDLAERVLLSRSGLTRLVDRLERQGLLERATCPTDARGSYAVLTEAGRERICAARATHRAGVRERFIERLTPEELDSFAVICEQLAEDSVEICSGLEEQT